MIRRIGSLLLLGVLCFALAAGQDTSSQEREQGLRYLAETRDGVTEAVKGLSEAQWKFKPAPDRWSIAEITEHLALIESLLRNILEKLPQAPAGAPGRDVKQVDEMILSKVLDRSTKAQAPPEAVPNGRWTPTEALDHFLANRSEVTLVLRSTADLRGHVINQLFFGPLDGYQWVLFVAAHSARHTKQILEVKADPRFPTN